MTEHDANTVYVVDTPESEEPIPPVYECTSDGVMHLWLIVPNHPSAGEMVQLSEEQMRAAMEFYDRSSMSSPSLGAGAVTTVKKDKVVDPYDSNRDDDDDNTGYRHYYDDRREAGVSAVLLSCADGNEVDAVALAVLLLTRFQAYSDSDSRGHDGPYRHAQRDSTLTVLGLIQRIKHYRLLTMIRRCRCWKYETETDHARQLNRLTCP